MFSFNLNAEEVVVRADECYAFATRAANYEWDNGFVRSDGEYYDIWNYWYNQCETGF